MTRLGPVLSFKQEVFDGTDVGGKCATSKAATSFQPPGPSEREANVNWKLWASNKQR